MNRYPYVLPVLRTHDAGGGNVQVNRGQGWVAHCCPYCGTTEGLRVKCEGYGPVAPEYTCEACFTGTDTGPSFDDLKPVAV